MSYEIDPIQAPRRRRKTHLATQDAPPPRWVRSVPGELLSWISDPSKSAVLRRGSPRRAAKSTKMFRVLLHVPFIRQAHPEALRLLCDAQVMPSSPPRTRSQDGATVSTWRFAFLEGFDPDARQDDDFVPLV